jgi:MFS family permease
MRSRSARQRGVPVVNPPYPGALRANYALAILWVAYILSFVDRQILSLLVGPIRKDLDISDFQISLLQGLAFALFYAFLGLPIGRLADRANRKQIIAVGIFFWSLMTALCGLAKNYTVLFFARMGVGVGEAALSPAAYSIFSDSFPPARLARAISIFSTGITVGSGMAYVIGGSVIEMISDTPSVTVPLLGELRPWQLTFLIVGAPGLLVALLALTIHEPIRRGLLRSETGAAPAAVPLRAVFAFIRQRWRCYGSIYLSVSMLAILGYGTMNWYPTFLIRTYNLPVGTVGLRFGLVFLIFGTAGALCAGLLSEWLSKRGYRDANLRVIVLVGVSLVAPAVIGPLMPNANLALLVAAPTMFLLNAYFGVSIAALQLVTPNQMRAVMAALFLFVANMIGMGTGASVVAFFTDFVFGYDLAIRYSLAMVAAIVCPLAALIAWLGLKHYRAALDEAQQWNS